jgi:hypothetical protein
VVDVSRAAGTERPRSETADRDETAEGGADGGAPPADAMDAPIRELDDRPTVVGSALALLVGTVAVGATLAGGSVALVSLAGLVTLAAGLRRGERRVVTLGAAVLFGGVLLAGVFGAPPEPTLVAAAATVVAWDAGEHAVGLGRQVGRHAETGRAELVHAAGSALVASTAAAAAYLAFRTLASQSVVALALLALGGLLIAALLRA